MLVLYHSIVVNITWKIKSQKILKHYWNPIHTLTVNLVVFISYDQDVSQSGAPQVYRLVRFQKQPMPLPFLASATAEPRNSIIPCFKLLLRQQSNTGFPCCITPLNSFLYLQLPFLLLSIYIQAFPLNILNETWLSHWSGPDGHQ